MPKVKMFEKPNVMVVYIVCNALTVLTMIGSVFFQWMRGTQSKMLEHIALCVVAIVFYNIPVVLRTKFRLHIPAFLHITVTIFSIMHFVFGEIFRFYDRSLVFDKVLHTTSGIIFGICGFSLVNGMNNTDKPLFKLSPFFVALFSLCFALAIGYAWELFEFLMDTAFGTNMQRWQDSFYVATVNGEQALVADYGQGKGLMDTMGDMIVNMVGAILISGIGYVWLTKKSKSIESILIVANNQAGISISNSAEAETNSAMQEVACEDSCLGLAQD